MIDIQDLDLEMKFIKPSDSILIPKKINKIINRLDKGLLKNINDDIEISKELCLYFLSFLTHSQYSDRRYVSLNAVLLSKKLRKNGTSDKTINSKVYTNIIKVLELGVDGVPIIYVDKQYVVGLKSRKYSLSDEYFKNGHIRHKLITKYVKDLIYRNYIDMLSNIHTNKISINSLKFYTTLSLPTKEELLNKGKELCKNNYTKRGKKLTMRYRKDKSYWNDFNNRTFVEDAINKFDYFTEEGFIIPIVGDDNCPRIYDSINLMNSWVRKEIKSNGSKLVETDITCLHPNLIMSLYDGLLKNITHEMVAKDLNIDIDEVKTLHLSFFNMEVNHMRASKLWDYYQDKDKETLSKVINDKNKFGYKYTSKLLFGLESKIMEKTIEKLNNKGIYVGYVFDALYGSEKNINIINETLNNTLKELDINTKSKIK